MENARITITTNRSDEEVAKLITDLRATIPDVQIVMDSKETIVGVEEARARAIAVANSLRNDLLTIAPGIDVMVEPVDSGFGLRILLPTCHKEAASDIITDHALANSGVPISTRLFGQASE